MAGISATSAGTSLGPMTLASRVLTQNVQTWIGNGSVLWHHFRLGGGDDMAPTSPIPNRRLRIDRPTYPITASCEHCGQRFMSRNEDLGIAAQHVREQFDAHKCDQGNSEERK